MPKFGRRSEKRLATCAQPIRRVMKKVVKHFDCTIIQGRRNRRQQNKAYADGASTKQWPDSKHNVEDPEDLSLAVDVAPYPIPHDWGRIDYRAGKGAISRQIKERARFYFFAGYVLAVARHHGYIFRWGGDWDQDTEVNDNRFDDLVHFEYIGEVNQQ